MRGRMVRAVSEFVKTYVAIVAVLFVLALVFAWVAHASLEAIAWQVYALSGLAYVIASVLAWTGFANLYRYSPTLFVGSPTYRHQVVRGEMWKEGRDNGALVIGVAFGVAIMALGAALFSWVFLIADAVGIGLGGAFLWLRRSPAHAGA